MKKPYWSARIAFRMFKDRLSYRIRRRFAPWMVVSTGTDCDGMRWEKTYRYWTRRGASEDLDAQYLWSEGPMNGSVLFAWTRKARECERGIGWADNRDRYAEREGY